MKNRILLLLVACTSIISCDKPWDCVKSTGPITTETRDLSPITDIYMHSDVDLVMHYDSVYRMSVTAGKNLLPEIKTEITGSKLELNNKNRYNWVRDLNPKIVVDVWCPTLEHIELYDADAVIEFADTLKFDSFRFDSFGSSGSYHLKLKGGTLTLAIHNGPADLKAEGKAGVSYLYNVGYGKMDCSALNLDDIYLGSYGTNDVYVNVNNVLEADLHSRGNVYYTGTPAHLKEKITGQGRLIHLP